MHNSDLITPQHLARKAVIYIRQSTPHQVVSHGCDRSSALRCHLNVALCHTWR